ncbi:MULTISPECIES: arylsulfatase [unclassified Lentimonas]|uniref:sulfatase family protein n=1 Tax=unclassified Lentimonas TaxID=2630993 RepID=UPI001323303E|nr:MULTISPECIES: arylsulfatase [unclassified Lentimonas]CAA6677740.1 Unannotated [Lentimonas sp. CC4]CAA6685004.1 Unannotated [Lentimonas sp. CC6]CAA6691706.1 Unannotated [Lentimonas sp. CC19]CAA6696045.1 Unannotated [Lentimonas sp. CC10]CAA7070060.1 Unannotated [Lentimonas sp. CC11]
MRTLIKSLCTLSLATSAITSSLFATTAKPNVIFIFADDMGYGEIQALNPEHGLIPTPHLDRLAAEGMVFTDAHTTSSVCTPSRYGLLTGRYNWRTTLQTFVLGDNADPLIAKDRMTLGHLFQEQGYHTAIFGKWHLGFKNTVPAELKDVPRPRKTDSRFVGPVPIGSKVEEGPITRGFDTFFGFHHARSMSSLIDDDTYIEEVDTDEVLGRLTDELTSYIDAKAADAKSGKPFFIYFPQSSPHSPIVPAPEWKGKGGLGNYSDFIANTDGSVGDVMKALERNGLRENTILIFSADNGSSGNSSEAEEQGHRSQAHFRARKASLYEGGHRVPFILSWPAQVEAASQLNQLVSLSDMMATFAEMFDQELPDHAAEDSMSFLAGIYGKPITSPRQDVVHHDKAGRFAIRKGDWKLLLEGQKRSKTGLDYQLYDLGKDVSETKDLAAENPERVEAMLALLETYIAQGRSTPGETQQNDAEIDLWKKGIVKKK